MGTTSDKLTYLNDTKTLLRQGINAIGGEIETTDTFRSYVDELENIYEELPKVTGSGTSVTLDDTRKGGLRVVLNPSELEQFTTTGKNKMPYNSYNTNDNRSMYMNLLILNAGTYTISFDLDSKEMGTNTNFGIYMNLTGSGGASLNDVLILTVDNSTTLGRKNVTFSISNDMISSNSTNMRVPLTQYDNGARAKLSNIQIETGSTATSYEPYTNGPSPNPSYPSQVHTITGDNEIKIQNKNKIIVSTCVGGALNTNGTYNNSGFSNFSISGNKITLTTSTSYRGFVSDYIECKPNTNYKLSYQTQETGLTYENYYCFYDENKQNGSRNQTGLSPANAKYMRVSGTIQQTTTVNFYNIQLEEGSTATSYVEHQEQVKHINLGSLEYCEIGDYSDEFYKNDTIVNIWDEQWELGYYDSTGNKVSNSNAIRSKNYIPVQPNKAYYFYNGESNNGRVNFYDKDKTFISTNTTLNQEKTTPNNCYYMLFSTGTSYGGTYNNNICINVSNANINGSYIPYKDDKWYIKKNIGKVVLDGSENWVEWSVAEQTNLSHYILDGYIQNNDTSGNDIRGKCDNYIVVKNSHSTEISLGLRQNGDNLKRIYVTTLETLNTLELFKTYLSIHNATLYYVLATPTYTLLNDTLQTELDNIDKLLKSYNGQTNISQVNDDLPFNMLASALESFEE